MSTNPEIRIAPERQADHLYHELLAPQEVQDVRADLRSIAEKVVAPAAASIATGDERTDGFPRAVFDALAAEGVYAIPFPADVGGVGLAHPSTASAAVMEELAYYSSSVAAVFDAHCVLAGNAINQGTENQRRRWLPKVVDGAVVGAFATTEPDASSDLSPATVRTAAERTATGWLLNGRKRWISNAPVAGFIVVLARTGERLSMFVVDTSLPGVGVGVPDRKMGNRGQLTADVHLTDVELTDDDLLGGAEGRGLRQALTTLTYGRIAIAGAAVGMAQAAFDFAVAHLSTRRAFGKPIATNQHWQFLLAERATEIENARCLYTKAALRLDAGSSAEPEAAMAKHYATRLSVDMARDAVQALGGLGFARELGADGTIGPLEAIYRDSKIGEIYEGSNEIQKWLIARQIFGRDITG